jgi:SNF2 family DNA or RNA helicase
MYDTLSLISRKGNKQVWVRVDTRKESGKIVFKFAWDPYLKDEIKIMHGARWVPETKEWTVTDNYRNFIALEYLQGRNPYAKQPVKIDNFGLPAYSHQMAMVEFQLSMRRCLNIGEMGVGKTLAVIISLLNIYSKIPPAEQPPIWYVAPKNALEASKYDFAKWITSRSLMNLPVEFMTYESMKSRVERKLADSQVPLVVIFDEISRLRTASSQRAQAAETLVSGCASFWSSRWIDSSKPVPFYVWGLTGTPAPKDPTNWYNLCEITNPGFIREGAYWKFRDRLAYTRQDTGSAGQTFTQVIAWKDNPKKCRICGNAEDHFIHSRGNRVTEAHQFEPGLNEVYGLYGRLKNIAIFTFKKDCLELPEKIFRVIKCPVKPETLQLAQLIKKTAERAITALINLRELSDGFQYTNEEMEVDHEACLGSGCDLCRNGKVVQHVEGLVEYPCPKDDVLEDELENFENRIVIYAGFTQSIDKICRNIAKDWTVLRLDGRGWFLNGERIDPQVALTLFDKRDENGNLEGRIAIVAHPRSAGMGLNFTASDTEIFYSNDFDGEARDQAVDRIHRPGSRGAYIVDLVHLPTDLTVLRRLKEKKDLQSLTMGDISLIEER